MRRRLRRWGPQPGIATATPVALPPRGPQPLAQTEAPGRLVRWALYVFLFSLPFDAPDQLVLELSTITGSLFLLATLWQARVCYGRQPAALWWFVAYLFIYWVSFALGHSTDRLDALKSFLFYVQAVSIFWACSNLMRHEGVTHRALITLVIAGVILAFLAITGLGKISETHSGRVVVFGQDPNFEARNLTIALLTAIGLAYGRARAVLRPRLLVWPIAALIITAMVLSGSRGQLLALAAGLWAFSLTGNTLGARVKNMILAVVVIGLCGWGAMQSPMMQRRIQQAESGNLAKREDLFPVAWQMFKERPLTGWGPDNQTVLAIRLRLPPALHQTRDTHNTFLQILTGTGILGLIPFLMGLGLCTWASWKARRGPEGILPFSHMAALWVANQSINFIVLKSQWVLFAYVLASASFLRPPPQQPITGQAGRTRRSMWG